MSKAIQQLLGFVPLTTSLRTSASGVPNPFPPEFGMVKAENRLMGERARYIRLSGERRTALLAKYGAPPRRRSLRDIADQSVRMLHTFESFPLSMTVLQQMQSFTQYEQDQGKDFVSYQLTEAAKRQGNTRIITTASVLRFGAIYWDADGNLLPSSSGATETHTVASFPSTHINQVNGCISASWALPNTDILGDIRHLQKFSAQETGMKLDACLYGINLPKYIGMNDSCQAYLARNPYMNDKIITTGEIPDGFGGIAKWRPVYTSFFENQNGTNQEIWNDDLALFMPNIDQPDKMTWWSMYEGSFPVPRSLEVQRDAVAAIANFEIMYGMFSYAATQISPPSIEVNYGDVWLPAQRNEKATFPATVAY